MVWTWPVCGITPSDLSLFHKEEAVEHDRFCESNGQNGLNQNLCRGARIASHRVRRFHADQTHREGCAESRQADMQVPVHMLYFSFWPALTSLHGRAATLHCSNLRFSTPFF